MCEDPVMKKFSFALDYKIEWDYISIESGAEENLRASTRQLPVRSLSDALTH